METLEACTVVTDVHTIANLDLMTCTTKDYENIHTEFCLEALHATVVTALAGYFDVFFDLPDKPVHFSTGPQSTPTHWKQVLFYLQEPIVMTKGKSQFQIVPLRQPRSLTLQTNLTKTSFAGEKLAGELTCRRHRKHVRSLEVDISVQGKKYSFNLN